MKFMMKLINIYIEQDRALIKYYWDFKIFGYSPAYVGHAEVDDGIQ